MLRLRAAWRGAVPMRRAAARANAQVQKGHRISELRCAAVLPMRSGDRNGPPPLPTLFLPASGSAARIAAVTLDERIDVALARMERRPVRLRSPADSTDADVVLVDTRAELRRVRSLVEAAADELQTVGHPHRARWFHAQLGAGCTPVQSE